MKPQLVKTSRHCKAFTLVELLITLIVTGILLSAVATLAFAMSSGSQASDDIAVTQAQLRQTRVRLGELIRNCRLICAAPGNDVVIWQADSNGDGRINVAELVYIERGNSLNTVRLCQFAPTDSFVVQFQFLSVATYKAYLVSKYTETYVSLIPTCANVQFNFDENPPFTRRLAVSFSLTENGVAHRYEVNTTLRARAGHIVNDAGSGLVSDDD